ncbi:MoaD/ThiS family protein [Corynebacterium tapiri]|uniref:MoaD/ThiS family protein n=1 Tax=Corynebacterium tapiri TaxID=1448266 RepID=A0A5C4U574_9CORY|nr:MoaD/ThiS family protein [Corynebacterium tapiri]TNL97399.1 MoaD/ThiS family protein [Corynebacterium tapiri]
MEIHYFAAARAAAGCASETVTPPATLKELLVALAAAHSGTTDSGLSLGEIFHRCTFLADGTRVEREHDLTGVSRIDVLPPFAGG